MMDLQVHFIHMPLKAKVLNSIKKVYRGKVEQVNMGIFCFTNPLFWLFSARRNNWPPLPDKLPIQPCFYQDINVDIPVEFQRIVRNLYYLWIAHFMMLLVNSLAFLLRMFTLARMEDFVGFGLSLFYIIIFSPASYVCWFRPAYKAFK